MARRRLVTLVSAGLLALATALVGVAGIASAHYKTVTFTCSTQNVPTLHISLTSFSTPPHSGDHNTVSASIDGTSVLSTTNFTNSYVHDFTASPNTTGHSAEVIVTAWDSNLGRNPDYDHTYELTVPACVTQSSPSVAVSEAPSVAVSEAPSVAVSEAPSVAVSEAPSLTYSQEPSQSASYDPCSTFVLTNAEPIDSLDPCSTPFESFAGETSDPTPPPTSMSDTSNGSPTTPLFALLICLAFGGLGIAAVEAQRRSIRR